MRIRTGVSVLGVVALSCSLAVGTAVAETASQTDPAPTTTSTTAPTDAPETSLRVVAHQRVSLLRIRDGEEVPCETLDRCLLVSRYVLERAVDWLG